MPETMTPETQAELEKLRKDNAAMGYRLRAHEKIVKELGDAVEYDAYGNPLSIRTEEPPRSPVAPTGTPGNPFSAISTYVPEFNPQSAEQWYQQQTQALLAKQGYVTTAQASQLASQAYHQASSNAAVWRMYDRMTAQEPYKALADPASPLSVRTAKLLLEHKLGAPLQADPVTGEPLTGAVSFDRWSFRDLTSLSLGAKLAAGELEQEAKVASSATASAVAAQGAGALSPTPQATSGAAGPGKPDASTMVTPGGEVSPELSEALANEVQPR